MNVERIGALVVAACIRRPWWTVAVCVTAIAVLGAGATRLTLSTDYRIFFSSEDPQLEAFEALEETFTRTDNVVFVVNDPQGDVFGTEALSALGALTDAAWDLPFVSRVDSLTNFQYARAVGDELVVSDLVPDHAGGDDAGGDDTQTAASLRTIAMNEPLLVGGLVSGDGHSAAVNVTLHLPREEPGAVVATAAAARALVAAARREHPTLEVHASGMAMMNDAFMEASLQDMSLIIPAMGLVMLLVMVLALRSASASIGVVGVVGLSAAAAAGTAGWLGYPLTPPSAAAPAIVMTLAVADGIHLVVSARQALARGLGRAAALIEAGQVNFRPILLTSLTTMTGFLCLNFAEAPPYGHLANMTAVGIGVGLVTSMTLLPAVLSILPMSAAAPRQRFSRALDLLSDFVIRRRRSILVASVVVSVVLGVFAERLESNDHFVGYFDDSISFRPETDFLLDHMGGIYGLEFALDSGAAEGISEPAYLAQLDSFSAWLRAQPEVTHVHAYSDIIKRLNDALHDSDGAHYRVPDERALASQYLLLYELSLPEGLGLNDRISVDRSSTRLTVTVGDLSTRELRDFTERAEGWLSQNAPPSMWTTATAPVVIFSHLSERNTRSMMRGNVLTLILISLSLVLALGSLRLGLISLAPNLLPIIAGYGLWWLFFGEINIVASVSGAICLGIIVDDTIHFLSKYQLSRRAGASPSDAVKHTLARVGPALVVTSGVLVAGFGVLTQSGFQMNSYLGLLTVMVVALALLADLILLPALLMTTEALGKGSVNEESTNEKDRDLLRIDRHAVASAPAEL